jgi:hypothetical protein
MFYAALADKVANEVLKHGVPVSGICINIAGKLWNSVLSEALVKPWPMRDLDSVTVRALGAVNVTFKRDD